MEAQWDIFTLKIRESEEWCIPKKVISERANTYPVPPDVKNEL